MVEQRRKDRKLLWLLSSNLNQKRIILFLSLTEALQMPGLVSEKFIYEEEKVRLALALAWHSKRLPGAFLGVVNNFTRIRQSHFMTMTNQVSSRSQKYCP